MKRFCALTLALLLVTGTALAEDSGEINPEPFAEADNKSSFGAPDITSPSAILIERETGEVLFEKNADDPREPASVTKVMTMLLTVEAIESGRLSLDDIVTASEHAAGMGGTNIYLFAGERMSVRDMLKAVATNSANDCASALAEHLAGSESGFADKMNARAAELGMTNTHFSNASGLLDDTNHVTTARDIAVMSRELIRHDLIKQFTTIWTDSVRNGGFELANTNKLIRYYEGATGLKTGYTSRAGYCVSATAERGGVGFVAVVMGDKTSAERFESARLLLNYAFAGFTTVAAEPDEALRPIPVELGRQEYIQPVVSGRTRLLVRLEDAKNIERRAELTPRLKAPVNEGDVVGRLTLSANGKTLGEFPLVASQGSARLTWVHILGKILAFYFT
ncbi:MAG: D-alanyl-D-alanine carboxypeptidase [Oscillospiraceae bacterium]|jgi:D-alanyl-D-alanine carboxypeptidase (penicillin-binding protein 5/6)|nr:D-alanyl-D-alanine carboxypeptidase [Oscillospiraceae bacterium]